MRNSNLTPKQRELLLHFAGLRSRPEFPSLKKFYAARLRMRRRGWLDGETKTPTLTADGAAILSRAIETPKRKPKMDAPAMSFVPLTHAKLAAERVPGVRGVGIIPVDGRHALVISARAPSGAKASRSVPTRGDGFINATAVASALGELLGPGARATFSIGAAS